MTRRGHYQTGVGLALSAGAATIWTGFSPIQTLITIAVAMVAAALPDILEMKWYQRGIRHSVIPHRTLTHWLAPWTASALWITWSVRNHGINPWIASALLGVVCGCIGHILMDWLTPMGVPVISPLRRHSLRLIHSGNLAVEGGIAVLLLAAGALALLASMQHGW